VHAAVPLLCSFVYIEMSVHHHHHDNNGSGDVVVESPQKRSCHWCGKPDSLTSPLLQCAKCKDTVYCSSNCQRWDYKCTHKKVCQTFFSSSPPQIDVFYGPFPSVQKDCHHDGDNSNISQLLEYYYVLLRTRNDEIHFKDTLLSPKKGCVYEILLRFSENELQEKFPGLVDEPSGKTTHEVSDVGENVRGEGCGHPTRSVGWVDNNQLKDFFVLEYRARRADCDHINPSPAEEISSEISS